MPIKMDLYVFQTSLSDHSSNRMGKEMLFDTLSGGQEIHAQIYSTKKTHCQYILNYPIKSGYILNRGCWLRANLWFFSDYPSNFERISFLA